MTYHMEIITFLAYCGGATQAQLSRYFNRPQQTIDRQVRSMIDGGLVRPIAQIAANNRQAKFVSLTARAASLLERSRYAVNDSSAFLRKSYLRSEWVCLTGYKIIQADTKGMNPLFAENESRKFAAVSVLSVESAKAHIELLMSHEDETELLLYDSVYGKLKELEPGIFERVMSFDEWVRMMPDMDSSERGIVSKKLREAKEKGETESIRIAPFGNVKAFNVGREPVFIKA